MKSFLPISFGILYKLPFFSRVQRTKTKLGRAGGAAQSIAIANCASGLAVKSGRSALESASQNPRRTSGCSGSERSQERLGQAATELSSAAGAKATRASIAADGSVRAR